jgi:hypothetical protein
MLATISALPGGTVELWDEDSQFGASAVFLVQINYETEDGVGSEEGRLVIDCMNFPESPWIDEGAFHGREIPVEAVDNDDMNGSIYFLATHTPIHAKKVRIFSSEDPKLVNVEMSYRLIYDQSGLGDDEDAMITAKLELEN